MLEGAQEVGGVHEGLVNNTHINQEPCSLRHLCALKVQVKSLHPVALFEISLTVAYQPPPSMGFSRQEYWNGLLLPSPGDLPDPGIKPGPPALQVDALPSEQPGELLCAL